MLRIPYYIFLISPVAWPSSMVLQHTVEDLLSPRYIIDKVSVY